MVKEFKKDGKNYIEKEVIRRKPCFCKACGNQINVKEKAIVLESDGIMQIGEFYCVGVYHESCYKN